MEIRRSVMGRPNLSVRGTVISRWSLVVSRWSLARIIYGSGRRLSTNDWFWKRDAGGNIPAGASFPMHSSRSAGGASVSARTLGLILLANFAFPWRTLRSKAFNREERENHAKGARKNIPRRHGLGMPEGRGGRKLASHYRACRKKKGFKVLESRRPFQLPLRRVAP